MRPDVPSNVVLNDVSTFQCCVQVQVVKSESESSPLSPSPSHHLKVRVRVITSESESASPSQKKIWVRVTNLVVHIFNICLSSKTWKQTTKCIECQSKQRNTARQLLLGLWRDSGPSHDFWVRVKVKKNWTRVRVRVKWTRVRVPTWVTQHWILAFLLGMYNCPLNSCYKGSHRRTGPVSCRAAEVSCPNLFYIACPKIKLILPENGHLKNSGGGGSPSRKSDICRNRYLKKKIENKNIAFLIEL